MILRDYQQRIAYEGFKILKTHKIVYLSMEVRTGKTLTALRIADIYEPGNVLFVTKKKAIQSIEDDYDKIPRCYNIAVTNYEQLHNVHNDYDLIIIDEAHGCGGFPAVPERVKELKRLCKEKPVIYLSGTPTPESWSQIYHQFFVSSFSPFAEYKSFYSWAKDFVTVKTKYMYNREFKDYSTADKEKIDQHCKHLFISFTQTEAGFESPIEEKILRVKMKPSTYALIDRLKKDRIFIGQDGSAIEADTEVKLMQKIHQICSGSVITDVDTKSFDMSKAEFIKEYFAGKKIAIFYKYIGERAMLQWHFAGRTTESPEDFNANDHLIFISQIQSGREGINLSTADCLVMFNVDFSAVSYWQARARLQTKSRDTPALVYWIFSENGIEDKIYQMVMNKRDYTLKYFLKDYAIKRIASTIENNQGT